MEDGPVRKIATEAARELVHAFVQCHGQILFVPASLSLIFIGSWFDQDTGVALEL